MLQSPSSQPTQPFFSSEGSTSTSSFKRCFLGTSAIGATVARLPGRFKGHGQIWWEWCPRIEALKASQSSLQIFKSVLTHEGGASVVKQLWCWATLLDASKTNPIASSIQTTLKTSSNTARTAHQSACQLLYQQFLMLVKTKSSFKSTKPLLRAIKMSFAVPLKLSLAREHGFFTNGGFDAKSLRETTKPSKNQAKTKQNPRETQQNPRETHQTKGLKPSGRPYLCTPLGGLDHLWPLLLRFLLLPAARRLPNNQTRPALLAENMKNHSDAWCKIAISIQLAERSFEAQRN